MDRFRGLADIMPREPEMRCASVLGIAAQARGAAQGQAHDGPAEGSEAPRGAADYQQNRGLLAVAALAAAGAVGAQR